MFNSSIFDAQNRLSSVSAKKLSYRADPFTTPNQQRQSIKGTILKSDNIKLYSTHKYARKEVRYHMSESKKQWHNKMANAELAKLPCYFQ